MEQPSKSQKTSKQIFIASLFYTFLIATVATFLFHIFGIDWFNSVIDIKDPSQVVQEIVKAILKAFELLFMYKLIIKRSFPLCLILAVVQTVAVGFIPMGIWQGIADAAIMLVLAIVLRKDKGWAIVDFIFVYALETLYALLFTVTRFGEVSIENGYSFYANIAGLIDYKLFVVTLYLYVKYKGGIKFLWMKRRLLS